ncbi:sugar-binding domain-containing protein [Galbibacter mesophilus]|uniref:sugar-binding domain-containing protein n=1 Tax=Galbibacter mesophilus TaxID=379069 RepID=UPI00191E27A3|nr:sugar-binding domain-containing protein [Galbibacter mesophilus]MCM5664063.1 beta-glucuronidase [Galbibacter mesophilus]
MKFFSDRLFKIIIYFSWIFVLLSCERGSKTSVIDLSGKWSFQIDSLDKGMEEKWFSMDLNDSISLPGSMAENGKGNDISLQTHWTGNMWNDSLWYKSPEMAKYRKPNNLKVSFWLQPDKTYKGAAWYQKKITIPEEWQDKHITLSLERAHWETTLWVDDKKVGMQNTLGTPHIYTVSEPLTTGEHTLTLRIDNRIKEINVGEDAHSISDNTQTNWNGVVGEIKLEATAKIHLEKIKVIPDINGKQVTVTGKINNPSEKTGAAKLLITAKGMGNLTDKISSLKEKVQFEKGINDFSLVYPMGDDPALWDEFNTNLYQMELVLETEAGTDVKKVEFGMREFKAEGTQFTINGRPVFLRGTLECAIFPLTGYVPTDVGSWQKIMKTIKNHGLNHMRFHSYCPPEAAFKAADASGVYLQVEASAWAKIGDGKPIDTWLYKEAQHIIDTYGNHPSFVMMAYGNEPSGDHHKEYLVDFVNHFKAVDSTKVYTSGAGWPYIENADFYNSAAPRIQHWNQQLKSIINSKPPQTTFDYSEIVKKTPMPHVAHEIGQWCVYPNFKEMKKYTGVLKPKNFEIFKETLEENQMGALADSLLFASGKLQTLCYKADIEAALRTKNFAGFQLLDLHDFPGQGTALVGVLDAFWEEKGYVSPEEYREFCSETVPLARLKKHVFYNTESFKASIEIAHFAAAPLKNTTPSWKLTNKEGSIFSEGKFNKKDIPIGNGIPLGEINVDLNNITKAEKLTLTVNVADAKNTWDVWVYPREKGKIEDEDKIKVTDKLDPITLKYLRDGGSVLLNINKGDVKPEKGGSIGVGFSSIFWNTSWTKGQKPHTLGILCDPNHPALKEFPTEYHSNWQWWDAMSNANAIVLDEFSPALTPVVRIIDDWFENRRAALLFEAKVGGGKLFVSGVDLHSNLEDRLEAQQLLYSIKKYMSKSQFNPKVTLSEEKIKGLFL